MGEVKSILDLLKAENPKEPAMNVEVFADALSTYIEATANISKNGAIVSHPRTGAPIENPYLKIQTQKGAILTKMGRIKSNETLASLADQLANKSSS